jgi:hypothetical protein
LPIGSETDVTSADDAPLSGSTIGLLAGGIAMLLIGIAVILFVLAKRRREKRQKTEGTDASGSAKSKSGAELKDRTYSSVSLVNSFVNGGDAVASGDSNGTVTSNYSNMPMKPKPRRRKSAGGAIAASLIAVGVR